MENMEIIPLNPEQKQAAPATLDQPIKRILASMMKKAGAGDLFVEAMGKKMRYDEYLSLMLWDAATTGLMYFADGTIVRITEFKEWLDLVKFMAQHMDGPAVVENTFNGVNIFKVYSNIDDSKV